MNILQCLRQSAFELPKERDSKPFPDYLRNIFNEYISAMENVNEGSIVDKLATNRKMIEEICSLLISSAEMYYHGFPAKAYFEFEKAMLLLEPTLMPKGGLAFNLNEPYYRARVQESTQLNRKDIFHVPFEIREKVTTQRFSVPGLPCLYLSNMIYVCWEELRRPDLNKMQVSRFKLENASYKFLDISFTSNKFIKQLESRESGSISDDEKKTPQERINEWDPMSLHFLICWPLFVICALKVKKEKDPFKPEYIFPQFLLQWVTHSKKFDGIKYYSIPAHTMLRPEYATLINYAIPVTTIADSGHCIKLCDAFSLTKPVSWELLTMVDPEVILFDLEKLDRNVYKLSHGIISFDLVDSKPRPYLRSIFGKLELELAEMEFEKIKPQYFIQIIHYANLICLFL